MEIFKPIDAATWYEVSNLGRVRNVKTGRILKNYPGGTGATYVTLKGGICLQRLVHHLVAEAFLVNPENKRTIRHLNGNKADNRVENLAWATHSETTQHLYESGLRTHKPLHYKGKFGAEHARAKGVLQSDGQGQVLARYGSMVEASRATGVGLSSIHLSCEKQILNRRTGTYFTYQATGVCPT